MSVDDGSWEDSKQYKVVIGSPKFTFDQIPAGGNVTHSFVLSPLKATARTREDKLSLYPATIHYKSTRDATTKQLAYSNDIGRIDVYTRANVTQIKAPAYNWLFYAILCFAVVALPLYNWKQFQDNYSNGIHKSQIKGKK